MGKPRPGFWPVGFYLQAQSPRPSPLSRRWILLPATLEGCKAQELWLQTCAHPRGAKEERGAWAGAFPPSRSAARVGFASINS